MIIEVFLSHKGADVDEYTQAYIIDDLDDGENDRVYNIKSNMYSTEVVDIFSRTMCFFGATTLDNKERVQLDLEDADKYAFYYPNSRLCLTHNGVRIELTFLTKGRVQVLINHKDLLDCDINGNVYIDEKTTMPFSVISKLKHLDELVKYFSNIIIINMVDGRVMSTTESYNTVDAYCKEKFNTSLSDLLNRSTNNTSDAADAFTHAIEGIIASYPSIVFSDCYTSIEHMIEKEELDPEEDEEILQDTEFNLLLSQFDTAREGVESSGDLPHAVYFVNADPYEDPFYDTSQEGMKLNDGFHEAMKEIMHDPDAQKFIKDCLHQLIDGIFTEDNEKAIMNKYYEKPDGSESIQIYRGYIDDEGKLHIQDDDGEEKIINKD